MITCFSTASIYPLTDCSATFNFVSSIATNIIGVAIDEITANITITANSSISVNPFSFI